MNNIPICFCFNNNFSLPAWVSIKSLIDTAHQKTVYSIYILYDDLSNSNIKLLKELVKYNRHLIKFIDVKYYIKKIKVIKKVEFWPKIIFARLFIPEILDENKVIYSDVDVVFKRDLHEIFSNNLEGSHYGLVAAERLNQSPIGHKRLKLYKNKYIYYNGFIIFNSKLCRKEKICYKFLNIFEKNTNEFGPGADLELMNVASSKIHRIPLEYCLLESLILYNKIESIPEYGWLSQLYPKEKLKKIIMKKAIIHYTVHGEHRDKPWKRLAPPEDYKKYIYLSPYKNEWLANKFLKKVIMKSPIFLRISNSALYKKYLFNLIKRIITIYIYIFNPIYSKAINYKVQKRRNIIIHKEYGHLSNQDIFKKIYREKTWDIKSKSSFNSGPGSHDLEVVNPYVNEVSSFLKLNKNLIVLDLGCGDFNIGSKLYNFTKSYIGIDIVDDLIKRNKEKFKADNLTFKTLDIINEELPNADCILVKEVFQHITNDEIEKILLKVKNCKYLFITESRPFDINKPNMDKIKGPHCRTDIKSAIIIEKPPFNFKFKTKKQLLKIKREDRFLITTFYKN